MSTPLQHDIQAPLLESQQLQQTKEEENQNEANTPTIISIGPCHGEKAELGKHVKEAYMQSFFAERVKRQVGDNKREISAEADLKAAARSFYGDKVDHMSDDELVDMLLLDGCFILEFLLKLENEATRKDDEFMKDKGNVTQTLTDMLFIDNQIPFFILFELYKLTSDDQEDVMQRELVGLVRKSFVELVPKLTPRNVNPPESSENERFEHILKVVHSLSIPRNEDNNSVLTKVVHSFPVPSRYEDSYDLVAYINTAAELEDSGVGFRCVGKVYGKYNPRAKDCTTLFDVRFNNGTFEIPSFKIQHTTEMFFRQMIAFEQKLNDNNTPKYFSAFVNLMDQLIDSAEDVKLLRNKGIIVNLLGKDDEEVVRMFEKLDQGILDPNIFSRVYKKVNRYCQKRRYKWYNSLTTDHYSDPWKAMSTTATAALVVSGLMSTVITIAKTLS